MPANNSTQDPKRVVGAAVTAVTVGQQPVGRMEARGTTGQLSSCRGPHDRADAVCGRVDVLVLPHPNHDPSRLSQGKVLLAVTLHVSLQLGRPPLSVAARRTKVLGALMPEAPVDEDRHARTSEDNIRPAPNTRQRLNVLAEAETAGMQGGAQHPLG
jgi:hypothetical protein